MTWNMSVVDGPIDILDLGPPDADGVRPVLGVVPGYHLNVARSVVPTSAEAFEVAPDPSTPVRVFAGDERGDQGRYRLTAFLIFADQAEAVAALPDLWFEPEPTEEGEP